jgi:hypothetical protein
MNHLKPIPGVQQSLGPTRTRHDRSIVFHRNTVALQSQLRDKLIKAGRLRKRGKVARLTVQNYRERHNASSLAGEVLGSHWTHLLIIRRNSLFHAHAFDAGRK